MSVKKYFGLTAVGIASLAATSAMAGGPDMMAAPAPDYSGFYVEGDAGYGISNWAHFAGGVFSDSGRVAGPGSVYKPGSGFSWGGDIGYQFNQYYSVELGAYDLASAKGFVGSGDTANFGPANASPGPVKVTSWIMYAAGKLAIPLFIDNLDIFGKAGFAWRFLDYSGAGVEINQINATSAAQDSYHDSHYATWLLGAGLQYWIMPELSVNLQYLHVPARTLLQNRNMQGPNVNLFLAGVGYKFNF